MAAASRWYGQGPSEVPGCMMVPSCERVDSPAGTVPHMRELRGQMVRLLSGVLQAVMSALQRYADAAVLTWAV